MNETNRNTRTLIVGFFVAVMVLIPLRFVEVGQMIDDGNKQVLGETMVNQEEVVTQVPEVQTAVLEEPYKTIENNQNCLTKDDVNSAWAELRAEMESNQISQSQATEMMEQLVTTEQNSCK
jgi:hypothetical protein